VFKFGLYDGKIILCDYKMKLGAWLVNLLRLWDVFSIKTCFWGELARFWFLVMIVRML